MSGNPQYDLFRDFEQQIMNSFTYNSVIDLFRKFQVPAGSHMVDFEFALPIGFSVAEVELIKRTLESFRSTQGEYQLPMIQKSIELTQDQYDLMVSKGQIKGYMDRVGAEIAANADKTLVFNNGLTAQQKPFYGVNDHGSGSGSATRPIQACGNATLTKAGAWTTTALADTDRAALAGAINQFYDLKAAKGQKLVLCYAAIAEGQFLLNVPGSTTGQRIRESWEKDFDMIPMPFGPDSISIHSHDAAACTATNWDALAFNPAKYVYCAPRPPKIHIRDERDSNVPRIYIDYEVYGATVPIPYVAPNGTVYKAAATIESVGA